MRAFCRLNPRLLARRTSLIVSRTPRLVSLRSCFALEARLNVGGTSFFSRFAHACLAARVNFFGFLQRLLAKKTTPARVFAMQLRATRTLPRLLVSPARKKTAPASDNVASAHEKRTPARR
jgi:hypothetical protein